MSTKITVSTTINVPIAKVWDYYTIPKHIVNWNFASADWHCPKVENDLRMGGKYIARMEAKDGSFGFDFITFYDVINAKKELSYTMEDGRKAKILFESVDNESKIIITFDAETQNPIELQQQGWQAILNNFKNYSETN